MKVTKLKQNVTLNTDVFMSGEENVLSSQSLRYYFSYTENVLSYKFILNFQRLKYFGAHYFSHQTCNFFFYQNMQNFKGVSRLLGHTEYFLCPLKIFLIREQKCIIIR